MFDVIRRHVLQFNAYPSMEKLTPILQQSTLERVRGPAILIRRKIGIQLLKKKLFKTPQMGIVQARLLRRRLLGIL